MEITKNKLQSRFLSIYLHIYHPRFCVSFSIISREMASVSRGNQRHAWMLSDPIRASFPPGVFLHGIPTRALSELDIQLLPPSPSPFIPPIHPPCCADIFGDVTQFYRYSGGFLARGSGISGGINDLSDHDYGLCTGRSSFLQEAGFLYFLSPLSPSSIHV